MRNLLMDIKGHIDDISHERVVGWAVDPERPDTALEVLIVVDGEIHATLSANEMREGLLSAFSHSTGRYQFRHEFSPALSSVRPPYRRNSPQRIRNSHPEWSAVSACKRARSPGATAGRHLFHRPGRDDHAYA